QLAGADLEAGAIVGEGVGPFGVRVYKVNKDQKAIVGGIAVVHVADLLEQRLIPAVAVLLALIAHIAVTNEIAEGVFCFGQLPGEDLVGVWLLDDGGGAIPAPLFPVCADQPIFTP